MSNFVNIPLGLKTTTQIPLNIKEFAGSEALLKDLGLDNNLAFTYHKDLEVTCLAEGTKWRWREVQLGEENTGLLDTDFTYPSDLIAFGIDYSNKKYNFFNINNDGSETKINSGTNVTITGNGTVATPYIINATGSSVVDATSSVKGILKLTNDLGGTADLPTTPTAVHLTGNETINGTKNFQVTTVNPSIDVYKSSTSGIGVSIQTSNNATGGTLLHINSTTGNAVTNTAKLMVLNAGSLSVGIPFTIQNSGVDTFTINKLGEATGTKFIKSGGTASQYLMADGSVSTSTDNLQKVITYPADFTGTNYTLTNADNNYEIIINNGATAVSITVPSGLTSKIGVGFTQKGTGDVSYVASGTTINNPIGLKIKGQYYQTFLSQEASTNIYYLGGNTKV